MVEEVRERVIRAAAYRPFEGGKRVFVVEAAEAMRDESQNALLKTLEEPPEFVHLILLSSEPAALLETIASRCQPVDFAPLPVEAVEAALAGEAAPEERRRDRGRASPPATSSCARFLLAERARSSARRAPGRRALLGSRAGGRASASGEPTPATRPGRRC